MFKLKLVQQCANNVEVIAVEDAAVDVSAVKAALQIYNLLRTRNE